MPMNVWCINTFKLEHARIDKGSKEAWLSFIQREIGMSTNLVILGRPPGRALFNVKSRTLRVLTMVSCWWRLNVVTMAIPLIFLRKKQEPTPFPNQDNELAWEELTWGTHIPPPTLGVCIAGQQNFKCVEFKSPSVVVPPPRHIEAL
jgi:hypothetical protein